ncbi:MAG: helix-turn-helix domain-containing protein [Pirellulales bacterium]|nr:helix-turn-helix domain-containing protein [Pirellulales bacterium]
MTTDPTRKLRLLEESRFRLLEESLPPWLKSNQAAELANIGERTLWRWSHSDIAPMPVKIGGCVRYNRDQFLEWIKSGGRAK